MARKSKNIQSYSAWYPKSDFTHYAYANSLRDEDNPDAQFAYKNAEIYLGAAHAIIGGITSNNIIDTSYNNLDALWRSEREIEQQFIRKYLKTELDFSDQQEVTKLLYSVNLILQDEKILDEVLYNIRSLDDSEEGGYKGQDEEIHAFTNYTLPGIISKTINDNIDKIYDSDKSIPTITKELETELRIALRDAIENELTKTLRTTGKNPYEDLYNYLHQLGQMDDFVERILEGYGVDAAAIERSFGRLRANKKNTKQIDKDLYKAVGVASSIQAGNVFEILNGFVLGEMVRGLKNTPGVHVAVQQTGQLNFMKADQILYVSNAVVDLQRLEQTFINTVKDAAQSTRAKREQNIQAMQSMLQNLKEMKSDVVEISDKSYKLTGQVFAKQSQYYGGFRAESPALDSLKQTLNHGQISSEQLEDLIFVLVNSGQGMLNGKNIKDAEDAIALNIASFLFDDVVVTDMLDDQLSSMNRIHVFNLNGVYVPLSVFLEAAAYAFKNNYDKFKDFVNVHFTSKNITPNSDANHQLTESDWNDFYQAKLKGNQVTMHFFGDFVDFIKMYMPKL